MVSWFLVALLFHFWFFFCLLFVLCFFLFFFCFVLFCFFSLLCWSTRKSSLKTKKKESHRRYGSDSESGEEDESSSTKKNESRDAKETGFSSIDKSKLFDEGYFKGLVWELLKSIQNKLSDGEIGPEEMADAVKRYRKMWADKVETDPHETLASLVISVVFSWLIYTRLIEFFPQKSYQIKSNQIKSIKIKRKL